MAQSLSFNLKGPGLPTNPTVPGIYSALTGSTPKTTALNAAKSGVFTSQTSTQAPTVTNPVSGFGGTQQQSNAGIKTSGLLGGADPQVKSRSEVTPDGKSVTENYFDPNAQKKADLQNQINTAQTELTAKQAEEKAAQEKANTGLAGNIGSNNSGVTYPGLVGGISAESLRNKEIGSNAAQLAKEAGSKISEIGGKGAQAEAGYLSGMGTNPVAMGNAGIVAQNVAAQQGAVSQGLSAALQGTGQQLTAQGQTVSGLGTAAGLAAPQQYGLYNAPFNPLTGEISGGGGVNRAINAANINSVQDIQTQINTIQSTKEAANANLDILSSYAKGIGTDTPIFSGITQLYGNTVQANKMVSAFQTQLQNVRAAYARLVPGVDANTAIPDDITPTGLKAVQQSIVEAVQNNLTNLENRRTELQQGTTTGAPVASSGPLTWDNI